MTGDDHGNGGTTGRFDQLRSPQSPPGCSVADWECIRSTSYVYPCTPLTDAQAAAYTAQGFEVGAARRHRLRRLDSGLARRRDLHRASSPTSRRRTPSIPAPTTNRTHCIAWSDWAHAAAGRAAPTASGSTPTTTTGRRAGSQDRPGFFTGSGMPMRFADTDRHADRRLPGRHPDDRRVGADLPATRSTPCSTRRLGAEGYYGAFTANMHTDSASIHRARRDRRLGPGPRRAGGLGQADARPGSTAATPPPSATSRGTADSCPSPSRRPPERTTSTCWSRHQPAGTLRP